MANMKMVLDGLECEEYSKCGKCPYVKFGKCKTLLIRDIQELLKEQQQKTGHWIRNSVVNMFGGVEIVCSVCGNVIIRTDVNAEHFCSNCGAKMEEQTDT